MRWQRQLTDIPKVDDLTGLSVGDEVMWSIAPVGICPNCGRTGALFVNAVVHATTFDEDRRMVDVCLSDVPEDSPALVVRDFEGNVLKTWQEDEMKNFS